MAYGERAQYVDIESNETKLDEMLIYSKGSMVVPVIVEGEKVIVGYGGT